MRLAKVMELMSLILRLGIHKSNKPELECERHDQGNNVDQVHYTFTQGRDVVV